MSQLRGVDVARSEDKQSPVSDRAALCSCSPHLARLMKQFDCVICLYSFIIRTRNSYIFRILCQIFPQLIV